MADSVVAASRADADDSGEANRLQQYEIVWIAPFQYTLADYPDGFGLEIQDFLGPGDPDPRGEPTVWVRGPVVGVVRTSAGVRLFRDRLLNVAIPHDQPRARRTGGAVLPPTTPGPFAP
jgi:hypothetical protein